MVPTLRYAFDHSFSEMENRLNCYAKRLKSAAQDNGAVATYPVDIRETDTNYVVEAELPGYTREQIDVNFQDGVLSITAEREAVEVEGEKRLSERQNSKVARHFRMPDKVDAEAVEAQLENGVLALNLPKRAEIRPRKIEVK